MLRQLQSRADDLAESLLISELEMRRSRTLEKKLEAYRDFAAAVDRIDALRRDVEELVHSDAKESILADLDRKIASVMRSPAYRTVEWFDRYCRVQWYVGQATMLMTQC
jgi:anti-sigma-K factor RskA